MAWFRKESTRGKPVTLAINGRGVAGSDFGLALLAESDFASDLVSSGLEWFWTSHDPNRRSGYEPETRLVTRLCQESKRAFLDDLPDYGNPEGRDIAMFGIRQPLGAWLIRPDQIREILWADWWAWQTRWLEGAIAQLLDRAKP